MQWIDQAAAELGGLDILVSNVTAGTALGANAWGAWKAYFEVDLMCAVRGFETALPRLQQSAHAAVIFVSSTAGLEHFPPSPPGFMALKASLITHAKTLAHHHGKDGIRINAITPGPIYIDGGAWEYVRNKLPQLYDDTLENIPLGRMGSAAEVGKYIAFIASPAASFINGANLVIDGGMTRRVG